MGKRTLFTDFEEVSNILPKWQRKEHITTNEQRVLHAFITSVCNDRWNRHFKKQHKDWASSTEMRLQLPIVFMDYLLTRKSIRVKGPSGYYCELDNPQYKSLGLVLFEFRMQFPIIMSMLTAWATGISVVSRGNCNFYQLVHCVETQELHKSLMTIRLVAKELDVPLYTTHRYELLDTAWRRLYGSKVPNLTSNITNKAYKRRAYIMYAAADILAIRVHTNYDIYNNGEYGYHNLLRELHTTRYD